MCDVFWWLCFLRPWFAASSPRCCLPSCPAPLPLLLSLPSPYGIASLTRSYPVLQNPPLHSPLALHYHQGPAPTPPSPPSPSHGLNPSTALPTSPLALSKSLHAAEKQQYEMEFKRMIEEHVSFPSIVMYVVFNEGWGQYEVSLVIACFHISVSAPSEQCCAQSSCTYTARTPSCSMRRVCWLPAFT